MTNNDTPQPGGWLGVQPRPDSTTPPPSQPTTAPPPEPNAPAPEQAQSLGVPRPKLDMKRLDDQTARARWAEEEDRQLAADTAAQISADILSGQSWLARWLNPLGTFAWCLVIIAAGIASLILLSQGLAVLDMASRQPTAIAYPLIALVVILSSLVALAIVRLIFGYLRLRQSPRHSLQALSELRFRAQIRGEAAVKLTAARKDLELFLRQFPLDKAQETTWNNLGLDGHEMVVKLRMARTDLIERSAHGTDLDWIRALDRTFLTHLDSAADSLIWRYTRQVGVRTAVVPLAFWDDAVLILALARMIRSLCLVYNVRASSAGTLALMGWSLAALAMATELEHLHTTIQTQIHDFLCNHLGHAAAKVVDTIAPSVAQGTANGFFTWRVGRAAIKHLRPIDSAKTPD